MRFPFLIASRYLFAKKSQNIINIISLISVLGVATGTIALILVLSVFNGLHNLVGSLYSNFDADLKMIPTNGKVFNVDDVMLAKINGIKGVKITSKVLEDNALLKFGKRQVPATLVGVDSLYQQVTSIDSTIVDGVYQVKFKDSNRAVIGSILADQLNLRINFLTPLLIYVPDRTKNVNLANPESSFTTECVSTVGVFSVKQANYDGQYLLINLQMAQKLFKYASNTVSYLALKVDKSNVDNIQNQLAKLVGSNYIIQNRQEQHQTFFKMMKIEKIMAYLILSFILMIATFNVIGTLSMLIFEKKESIQTLKAIGADRKTITQIFLLEGGLITLIGIIGGIVIGSALILIQQYFALVEFSGSGSFIVKAYPVQLQFGDVLLVLITVSTVSALSVWYPVKVIVQKYYSNLQE